MPVLTRSAPLVGREQVLQRLWSEVAASASRGMRVAVLRGPAGSGKTRVLGGFADRARAAGATVLPGRSPAVGTHPYAVLADAVAAWVRQSPPAAAQVRRAGAPLVALVPALAPPPDGDHGSTPDTVGVVQACFRLVREVTERRPLVLIVDDAHLADPWSCEVIATLARHAAELPWTLALGWRDPAEEVRPEARRLLEAMRRERDPLEVALEPLDLAAAAEMVAALLGEGLPAPLLVEALHARSAGNPYYLEEMVRWLRDTGRLVRRGLQWTARPGSEEELPPSLEEAIRERAGGLPAEARELLDWLALTGGSADLELLAAVTAGGETAVAPGLDVLMRAGLVGERGARRSEYLVHHPLVAESIYRALSEAHRRLGHRRLAGLLAERGAPIGTVAAHHARAADPGDERACSAVLAAAAEAEAGNAWGQASTWYEEALRLSGGPDDPNRLVALDHLSALAPITGHVEVGLRSVDELLARADAGDPVRRVTLLRRLAALNAVAGDSPGARAAVEEGLRLASGGGPEEAMLLADLAMVALMTLPLPEVREVIARGRHVADASAAPSAALILRAFEAMAMADDGRAVLAEELATATARDAVEQEDQLAFGYAVFAASIANTVRGRFATALQSLSTFADVAEGSGLLWMAAWLHNLAAQCRFFCGDLDGSLRANLRAEELARSAGGVNVMPMPLIGSAVVLATQGRGDLAGDRLAEARIELDERPNVIFEGWYWFAAGMAAEARGELDQALAAWRRMAAAQESRGPFNGLPLRAWLVHGLAASGHAEEALDVSAALLALATEHDLPLALVTAQCARAEALLTAGEPVAAVLAAESAVATCEQIEGELIPARARSVLGRALLGAGRRAEARDLLLRVHASLAALGVGPEREQVAVLLRELGAAPPSTAARVPAQEDPPDGPLATLSSREREVAEMASAGLSSRSIALRMTLSERTVENHLQRSYAKLGLHSRAELIALVAGTSAGGRPRAEPARVRG